MLFVDVTSKPLWNLDDCILPFLTQFYMTVLFTFCVCFLGHKKTKDQLDVVVCQYRDVNYLTSTRTRSD